MGHPDVSPVGCFNVTNVGKCRANKVRISAGHWRLVHTSRFRKKRGSFDSPSNISNPINDHCFGAEIASHVLPPLYLTPAFCLIDLTFTRLYPFIFERQRNWAFVSYIIRVACQVVHEEPSRWKWYPMVARRCQIQRKLQQTPSNRPQTLNSLFVKEIRSYFNLWYLVSVPGVCWNFLR